MERWYFSREGDAVVLRARFETDDGDTVGDAYAEVRPGEKAFDLIEYQELFDAEAGTLVIEDEIARIAADDEDEPDEDDPDSSDLEAELGAG